MDHHQLANLNFYVIGGNAAEFLPGDRIAVNDVLAWLENDRDTGTKLKLSSEAPNKDQG